jgi:predicted LPLAT superfamily acyltransferase
MMSKHWSHINEVSVVWGMKTLYFFYPILGRNFVRVFLYPTIFWYLIVHKIARDSSREYLIKLAAFSKQTSPSPSLFNVFRHFFEFAECILDKVLIWGGKLDSLKYEFNGASVFDEILKEGRGAIVLVSHLGNLDLCRAISNAYKGVKVTVLVHTAHAKKFNQMLSDINQQSALNIIEVSEFTMAVAIELSERVEHGELIAIAGDRVPLSGHGFVKVDFLGVKANFPIGPYMLGRVLKCPLVSLTSFKKNGKYILTSDLIHDGHEVSKSEFQDYLIKASKKFSSILEDACLIAPFQWFNFFPFWGLISGSLNES